MSTICHSLTWADTMTLLSLLERLWQRFSFDGRMNDVEALLDLLTIDGRYDALRIRENTRYRLLCYLAGVAKVRLGKPPAAIACLTAADEFALLSDEAHQVVAFNAVAQGHAYLNAGDLESALASAQSAAGARSEDLVSALSALAAKTSYALGGLEMAQAAAERSLKLPMPVEEITIEVVEDLLIGGSAYQST